MCLIALVVGFIYKHTVLLILLSLLALNVMYLVNVLGTNISVFYKLHTFENISHLKFVIAINVSDVRQPFYGRSL